MLSLINWRLKVTVNDGRAFVGQMLAFDRHMNLVLAECEEFRRVRPKKKAGEAEAGPVQEMKRTLGLVILRGETVVSLSVEGPPPAGDDEKKNAVRTTDPRCARPPEGSLRGAIAGSSCSDGPSSSAAPPRPAPLRAARSSRGRASRRRSRASRRGRT